MVKKTQAAVESPRQRNRTTITRALKLLGFILVAFSATRLYLEAGGLAGANIGHNNVDKLRSAKSLRKRKKEASTLTNALSTICRHNTTYTGTNSNSSSTSITFLCALYSSGQLHRSCQGKSELLHILLRAGYMQVNAQEINEKQLCEQLPPWSDVQQLYYSRDDGDQPVVLGTETCQSYRDSINNTLPKLRLAGLYNSGTNAFEKAMKENLVVAPEKSRPIVPWDKHNLLERRHDLEKLCSNASCRDRYHEQFFMIVLVKDPFSWMKSMCKAPYKVKWKTEVFEKCQSRKHEHHKVPSNDTVGVRAGYEFNQLEEETFDTLADFHQTYYQQYIEVSVIPRLIIRFEDTLFQPEKVMEIIRNCTGAKKAHPSHQYLLDKAKTHGESSDFFSALVKAGQIQGRREILTESERQYAETVLAKQLELFHYGTSV